MEIRLETCRRSSLRQVLGVCELEDQEIFRVFTQSHYSKLAHGRRTEADPADGARNLRWIQPTLSLIGKERSPNGTK